MQAQLDPISHRLRALGPYAQRPALVRAGNELQLDLQDASVQSPIYASGARQLGVLGSQQSVVPVTAHFRASAAAAEDQQILGAGLIREDADHISVVFFPGDAVCFGEGRERELSIIKKFVWPDETPEACSPQSLGLQVTPVATVSGSADQQWLLRRQTRSSALKVEPFGSLASVACILLKDMDDEYNMVIPGERRFATLAPNCLIEPESSPSGDSMLAAAFQHDLPPAWRRLEVLVQRLNENGTICSAICRWALHVSDSHHDMQECIKREHGQKRHVQSPVLSRCQVC